MLVSEAIDLIANVVYKPTWSFHAEDHTNRFEGTIKVRINYGAYNTNRDKAREGYPEWIDTYAVFPLVVADCDTEEEFFSRLFKAVMAIEEHESREFYRLSHRDYDAPYHPHRIHGMHAYKNTWMGTTEMTDLQFGVG